MSTFVGEPVGERHDDREDHRRGADDSGTDEHRLGRGLEGVARAVVLFEVVFGHVPRGVEAEVPLDLIGDVRDRLDGGQLVHGLSVVGDRAVGVHGDGHRAHAQEAEGHQAEGEHGRGEHDAALADVEAGADQVADAHEHHDGEADVVGGEVTGHEARQDVERRPAFSGRGHDFFDVRRLGGGEDLDQFRDQRAGQRAHADDDGQQPPVVAVELTDLRCYRR